MLLKKIFFYIILRSSKYIVFIKKKGEIMKEYKVVHIVEGGCGTIFLGASGIPIQKMEAELNQYASDGWEVVFQVVEQKRFLLFWKREAVVITLGREVK